MVTLPPPPVHPSVLSGGSGLLIVYGAIAVSIIVGRVIRRVPFSWYLTAPLLALVVFLICGMIWSFLAALFPAWLQQGAGVVFCIGVGFVVGRWWPPYRRDRIHLRGTVIQSAADGNSRRRRQRIEDGQLTLAGVPVPPLDETKHFKMLGTTGTGKSTAIRELLTGALKRGDRAVFADPDGAYLGKFYDPERGDVVLNPFDPRSLRWDLFAEITNPYDFEEMARSLIPDGVGDDRIWHQYGQTFLASVLRQAHGSGVRDTTELFRLLTTAPIEELRFLLEGTPAQPFLASGADRMFGSTRSVVSTAVQSLRYINGQQSALFSIRQWVEAGRGVLFLPYKANQIASLRSMISTWMRIAIVSTLSLPEGDARLWFVVDELDALGPIDSLKDALPRMRKFGGRCVLGFQGIGQVSATYGRGNAEPLVENCGNTLILRCSASEDGGTAEFASRLIGEREIIREQSSKSHAPNEWFATRTTTKHFVTESAVLASQIEQLPDFAGFLKIASRPEWVKVRFSVPHVEGST